MKVLCAHPQHPPQPSIEVPWSPLLCPLHSPLGLNFLRKEDLRGKGKDWERKEGGGGSNHFRAWWWCIDGIVGITGRGSGVNLWGVRTGRGRTSHFWIMEGLFLEEEEMVMKKQKE